MAQQNPPEFKAEERRLDSFLSRQWLLFAGILLLAAVTVIVQLRLMWKFVPGQIPWNGTDLLLSSSLFVLVVLFGLYLMQQQKHIVRIRSDLCDARFRVREAEHQYRNRLMAIGALSGAIGDENDPRLVFDKLAQLCKDIFRSDRASLMLLNDKTQKLVVRVALGFPKGNNILGSERKIGEGIAGWVALHREPLLLGRDVDYSKFAGRVPESSELRSAMVIPLVVRGRVAGVLSVSNAVSEIEYNLYDLTTLQVFAETAEYCIRHAENTDWMRQLITKLQEQRVDGDKVEEPTVDPILPPEPDDFGGPKTQVIELQR